MIYTLFTLLIVSMLGWLVWFYQNYYTSRKITRANTNTYKHEYVIETIVKGEKKKNGCENVEHLLCKIMTLKETKSDDFDCDASVVFSWDWDDVIWRN